MYAVATHSLLLIMWVTYTTYISNPLLRHLRDCRTHSDNDSSEVLFLTPYVTSGRLLEGRKAAQVPPFLPGVLSYSGFFTVNETVGSNMFFWFFPSEKNPLNAPVVLWLQGGPGASSLFGALYENGPYKLTNGPSLLRNSHYWSEEMNVIYIDNPVGAGFSFTKNKTGYPSSEREIGNQLYAALVQFFELFPEYRKNDFFIAGESYAGKYVPTLAHTIHEKNLEAPSKINLKGIAIGNGLVDPANMLHYSDYLYGIGLIDEETQKEFSRIENEIRACIASQEYDKGMDLLSKLFPGDSPTSSLFENATGFTNIYNYLHEKDSSNETNDLMVRFFEQDSVREKLHVGDIPFNPDSDLVFSHLRRDFLQSVVPWLEVILDNYRVLLYNGQLDIICAYPLTMSYVDKLNWRGVEKYKMASRTKWYVTGELAGYAKSSGNFTEVLVRDAGHMVPSDQPLWALDMILRFVKNIPFDKPL